LLSRRLQRAQLIQKLNHAIPAMGLLFAATQALAEGARGWDLGLAIVEVVTTVMLAATLFQTIRTVRNEPSHAHSAHGIDWIDMWAAAVLFAEAAERWHLKHHIARPTLLTALVTLALALFHGRIMGVAQRRRALVLSDQGISVGGRPFQRFRAAWDDIAAISVTQQAAEIRTRTGRVRRLDLADLQNAERVRAGLEEANRRLMAHREAETLAP
jgi:hypothetical protein